MNLNLQKARLTRLCDGRPITLEFISATDDVKFTIFSDDNCKYISMLFNENLTDKEITEQLIIPALNNLDGVTFPERFKRKMEAIKAEMKELQNG